MYVLTNFDARRQIDLELSQWDDCNALRFIFLTPHLQASKAKLNEVIAQTEEEVRLCARELFALIDSVSKYKEYMASKINQMKNDLLETAGTIADIHRDSIQESIDLYDGNHWSLTFDCVTYLVS